MSTNTNASIHAAYPPPLHTSTGIRRFRLSWNNSRVKTRNVHDTRKHITQECAGVLFPSGEPARVALGTGQTFATLADMEELLELGGTYEIRWEDAE